MKNIFTAAAILIFALHFNYVWADASVPAPNLDLDLAKKIAAKSEAFAKAKKWNLSIAIVNSEGTLLYFQRDPAAYLGSVEAAIQKAKSANAFQRSTAAFVEGLKQGRMGLLSVPGIVAIEGGLPIQLSGKHVGAIGISGAKSLEDEEAAQAGLLD
ncbi:MAG: heme-binding protein [Bdellovibrionota bacterium]